MEQKKTMANSFVVLRQILSAEECVNLIQVSCSQGFEEAKVGFSSGAQFAKNIRNNERMEFESKELAETLWNRIRNAGIDDLEHAGSPLGLNPKFRFYRYSPGQRFKPHKDGKVKSDDGSQSLFTVLFYLNQGFHGGQTTLLLDGPSSVQPASRVSITPRCGDALIFCQSLWHEGAVVTEGEKYVLRSDLMFNAEVLT